jgi:taurine transport system ATP-binding protein
MKSKDIENEVLIDIQNVGVDFVSKDSTLIAFNDISIDIKKHEFVCLLGPSGCGKSTLLKVIAGYIKPTSGSVLMNNEEILKPSKNRGVVFQSPTLYPWLNVEDNVKFGPKVCGKTAEECDLISKKFIEEVDLVGFEKSATYELSGGMKQRVAIARALANYPDVILMDEPFGALDALTRANMQILVRDLWVKDEQTIFMITHDIDEALALGTKIIVMSKRPGKILKQFNTDFTNQIYKSSSNNLHYSEEYFKIKDEVLDLINSQTS